MTQSRDKKKKINPSKKVIFIATGQIKEKQTNKKPGSRSLSNSQEVAVLALPFAGSGDPGQVTLSHQNENYFIEFRVMG